MNGELRQEMRLAAMRLLAYDKAKKDIYAVVEKLVSIAINDKLTQAKKIKQAREVIGALVPTDFAEDIINQLIALDQRAKKEQSKNEELGAILAAGALLAYASQDTVQYFLSQLRISGYTYTETVKENNANSKKSLLAAFRQSVSRGDNANQILAALRKVAKTRLRQTLSTASNVMTAARGQARAIQNPGCKHWVSVSILDSATTVVCQQHAGKEYKHLYKDIPNKPPRTPPIHPCRSVLMPQCGREPLESNSFSDWLGKNDSEVGKWLGPTRYEAYKNGKIPIKRFIDLKEQKLWTVEELRERGLV